MMARLFPVWHWMRIAIDQHVRSVREIVGKVIADEMRWSATRSGLASSNRCWLSRVGKPISTISINIDAELFNTVRHRPTIGRSVCAELMLRVIAHTRQTRAQRPRNIAPIGIEQIAGSSGLAGQRRVGQTADRFVAGGKYGNGMVMDRLPSRDQALGAQAFEQGEERGIGLPVTCKAERPALAHVGQHLDWATEIGIGVPRR